MFTEASPDSDPTATPRGSAAIAAALKSIPGAVLMVDTELHYIAVGGRSVADVLSVHGVTPEKLLGARVTDVLHPEYQEPTTILYQAILAGHTPCFELLRAGRTFEVTGHPLLDFNGRIVAAIAHFHDVTDRAVAREELALERARVLTLLTDVETLIELLPDGLCIVADEHIVYVNDAFARTLGYKTAHLAGVHLRSVVSQRDIATVSERFDLSLVERNVGTVDVGLVSASGAVVPLEMSLPRRVSHRGAQACVAVFRDLRERKRLEAAAHARDRLATVGTLASGVGHEINNPLTFVMSNLEIMADELAKDGPMDDAQRRDLANLVNEALEGASRVKKVVRGLRTFARGEREERARLDVRQVVELSITFAFSELRHKVHVVREISDELPEVIADESRLAQVFINLLVNAAHALQDLPYERNMVRVRAWTKDGFVHIEFSDNGPGMSEEVRQRIFEPFFTTKPVGEGTGLGLSIAYNMLAALGGNLRCESRLGEGAQFTVSLPAATDEPGLLETPPPGVLHLPRRGRVLVVDDEPLVGSVARRILGPQHDVTVVLSAEEALALILGGQVYDCVLCDLMMPGTSGMELHAHVRGVLPQVAARFVFVSAGPTTEEAARFVESLSQPIIEKPFESEVLRARVGATVAMADIRRGTR